jgi:hypothetical protein
VPVCDDHRELIRAETMRYYRGSLKTYDDRVEYLKIAKRIPWSQANMGEHQHEGGIKLVTCPDCGAQVGANWLTRHKCVGGAAR